MCVRKSERSTTACDFIFLSSLNYKSILLLLDIKKRFFFEICICKKNVSWLPECCMDRILFDISLFGWPSLPLSLHLLFCVMLFECTNRLTCVDVVKAGENRRLGCLCGAFCHAGAAEYVRERPWEGILHANLLRFSAALSQSQP